MTAIIAIGAIAGLVSSVLLLSVQSGTLMAMLLSYFSMLPILIAGLGWTPYAAALGLCMSGIVLSLVLPAGATLTLIAATAFPALLLSHAARRAAFAGRNVAADLLVVSALLAALLTLALALYRGALDHEQYRAVMIDALNRVLGDSGALADVPAAQRKDMIVAMVPIVSVSNVLAWMSCAVINLYLAGRVVRASGRLPFGWPDVPSARLPRGAVILALVILGAAVFFGGFLQHVGLIALAAIVAAALFAGLAFVHDVTRGRAVRPLILVVTYLVGPVMALMPFIGLIDSQTRLRERLRLPSSNTPAL